MPERDRYIAGVPCWIDTNQPDPEAAAAFYSGLFGWEIEDAMPPGSETHYFMARLRGGDVAGISPVPEGAPPTARWDTYIWVESADETASTVRDAGGGVVTEPFDFMDASRVAVFTDPEGAAFSVWEAKKHEGARLVNDPGSLKFQRPQHARRRRSEVVLRIGVRMADADPVRRGRDVDAPRLRRLSRAGRWWSRRSTPRGSG